MRYLIQNQKDAAEQAAEVLRQEKSVLLLPTETVYGLVCDWSDKSARDRIYTMKHRDPNKLLAAFLPDLSFAEQLCGRPLPPAARIFAARFMPGPITLVVPAADGSTFGFRIPDHPFIGALMRCYGKPLASTSANRSGQPPALEIRSALDTLAEMPDCTVDGGSLPSDSMASTVILVGADNAWKILREGPISRRRLEEALEQPT